MISAHFREPPYLSDRVLFMSHRLVSLYLFDRLYDTKISGRYVNRELYVFAQFATIRRRASNQSADRPI